MPGMFLRQLLALRSFARATIAALLTSVLTALGNAGPIEPREGLHVAHHFSFHFSHHDWELACDNTRTCRAAGYQADDAVLAVSLLLTRVAGPGAPVQARVALGEYDAEAQAAASRAQGPGRLVLWVDGRALGALGWTTDQADKADKADAAGPGPGHFALSTPQLQAVRKALLRPKARIEFRHGGQVWRLSDRGASAVLLKMDEAQGRIGTPGALARPGVGVSARPEGQALPPLPVPVLRAARVSAQGTTSTPPPGLSREAVAALRQALLQQVDHDAFPPDSEEGQLRFAPLSGGQWLASTLCWRGAYNEGHCMWVVNARPPHQPRLVTDQASGYKAGVITAFQKGRGLADCVSEEAWVWDGRAFARSRASGSGQCKLISPGGAWALPTWVVKVLGP